MERHELLNTKLIPPRLPSALVPREVLLVRLNAGLDRKLTLISAPAGFGKTTLVCEWIAARSNLAPIAWVSLDAGDNDPIRFWRYFITACRSFNVSLGRSALAALRTSSEPSLESLLTTFINEFAEIQTTCVLVLEDYQVIVTPEIHQILGFVIDHLPANLHLILITRSEPLLPLARLRARNDLTEIGVNDLRFSQLEIHSFLNQNLQTALSADALNRIEEKTEGWAAGLRFIALALHNKSDSSAAEQILATFGGEQRIVLEFLVDEVLAAQSEQVQRFLLQTSVLNQLTSSLCDALTEQTDSALLLEQLERANLFLIPLNSNADQRWYRYHPLFTEAMRHAARQRLGESAVRMLLERACGWFEAHGLSNEAIEAGLAAQQFDHAAQLIEQLVEQHGLNELHTVQRWIDQLPIDILHVHPAVCFVEAMALLFTHDRYAPATAARIEPLLHVAEEKWRSESNDPKVGEVLSLRSIMALWQGDVAQAFQCAHESLELLSIDAAFWRGNSLLVAGLEALLAGETNYAQQLLMETRAVCAAAQNLHGTLAATELLGEANVWQGEFDQAAELYRQVLAEAVGGAEMLEDQGAARLGLAMIAFERNDLAAAEQHAIFARDAGERSSNEQLRVQATLLLARVQQAYGNIAQASGMLHELIARAKQPRLLREVLIWQARFSLAANDLAAVLRWQATRIESSDLPRTLQEQEAMLIARLQLKQKETDAALKLLDEWQVDAQAAGRVRSELEILGVKALAYFSQADRSQAAQTLIEALTLAQAQGFYRTLIDEGESMAALLRSIAPDLKDHALAEYVVTLLRSFEAAPADRVSSTPAAASILIEPLSAQEQRVLRLLAAGLSNPEIARELVVSVNTIKTQVQSIYRKLDVNNREDASEAAHELNLL